MLRRGGRVGEQQIQVLLLQYFEGLDDHQIARRLGKASVNRVYELRSRALKKLAQEPEWAALAESLLKG